MSNGRLAVATMTVIATVALAACGTTNGNTVNRRVPSPAITTPTSASPTGGAGKNPTMSVMPDTYRRQAPIEQRGRVERVAYTTTRNGRTYEKTAMVYLPHGYSSDTRYDILYILHGWSGSGEDFLGAGGTDGTRAFKTMLDHMIADRVMNPVIVVAPTYYPDSERTGSYYQDNGLNRSFARYELGDLIPAVESRYSTYAGKRTDETAVRQSRRHRAFGGFSMGSITTWYVLQYRLREFAAFMPMAGDSWTVTSDGGASQPDRTADTLAQAVTDQGYGADDFAIHATVGGADGTSISMERQIDAMHSRHGELFTQDNLIYGIDPDGGHDLDSLLNQAYSSMPTLFG